MIHTRHTLYCDIDQIYMFKHLITLFIHHFMITTIPNHFKIYFLLVLPNLTQTTNCNKQATDL